MTSEIWTPPKLVKWITEDLKKRGFPEPHRFEAETLVSHCLKISRMELYLQFDKPCTTQERTAVKALYQKRLERIPLPYLLGSQGFWGMDLKVGPGVLSPRPDTEILIEACLPFLPHDPSTEFWALELGSGSLAIPLSLAMESEGLHLISCELSSNALQFAKENLNHYQEEIRAQGNEIYLLQADAFTAIKNTEKFQLIVSNPPYIPSSDILELDREVKEHEPMQALDGGEDGLIFYRILEQAANEKLASGGYLAVEHGYDQQEILLDFFANSPKLTLTQKLNDHGGNPRVLVYQKQ